MTFLIRITPAFARRGLGLLAWTVSFRRLGSCCFFNTLNGYDGRGLLDQYEVTYKGIPKPVIPYLNLYDTAPLQAPPGFSLTD